MDVRVEERWAAKNWCFWTVVLEKTPVSPLDCKEIKPVNHKGNQSWAFVGRTDAEAEAPVLWPPDVKNWLIRKDPDAGKDWRQEEKGTAEYEMVGWYYGLSGYEFEQTPGVGERQGSLGCCSPWGRKESDTTEQLNWTDMSSSKGSGQLVSSNKRKTWKFGNRGVWMNVWEWIQSIEIFISHVNAQCCKRPFVIKRDKNKHIDKMPC